MIRTPLRPLARVLRARERGEDPNYIEQENLRLRRQELRDTGRVRAELRLLVLALMFLSGFVLLGARMGLLAATEPVEMRVGLVEGISDTRSDITDRNGRVLATNLATHALYAETRRMVDPVRAARELGRIFPELDADRLAARFTDPDRSFCLGAHPPFRQSRNRRCMILESRGCCSGRARCVFTRMDAWPRISLAARVLANKACGPPKSWAWRVQNCISRSVCATLPAPTSPCSCRLTCRFRQRSQRFCRAVCRCSAHAAPALCLMDAHTGEVLSLVSLPDFDPNDRPAPLTEGEPADSPLFNRAVQGYYELGSVMKAFTVAQALEEGDVTPDTIIDTRGPLRWGRFRINDFRDYGSEMSVTKVMVHSSNIGTARMAQEIGAERQQDFLRRFGFLDRMAIELAEAQRARPLLPEPWSELSAMTISYGHGLTTSPLALAAGYAALVNGGRQVTPTLLRRDAPPDAPQVISARSSAQMREILHDVVYEGTASFARIPGYPVGGKNRVCRQARPEWRL